MKECSCCGTINDDSDLFCKSCGTQLNASVPVNAQGKNKKILIPVIIIVVIVLTVVGIIAVKLIGNNNKNDTGENVSVSESKEDIVTLQDINNATSTTENESKDIGYRATQKYEVTTVQLIKDNNRKYITTADNGLIMRESASLDSDSLNNNIPKGTIVSVLNITGSWGYLKYNGVSGWVPMDLLHVLEMKNEKYLTDAAHGLIMRASANDNGTNLNNNIPLGTLIEITTSVEGWSYTNYKGISGWVHTQFLHEIDFYSIDCITTDESGLIMRSAANENGVDLYNNIPEGTEVTVICAIQDWGYTTYNGISGWVYSEFLEPTNDIALPYTFIEDKT